MNIRNIQKMAGNHDVNGLILALEDSSVRGLAARALGQLGDKRAVDALLSKLKAVDDRNKVAFINSIEEHVIPALGVLGDTRAVQPLIDLLNDEKNPNVLDTIEVLGNLGDVRAVQPLIDCLRKYIRAYDYDGYHKQRAIKALIKLRRLTDDTSSIDAALEGFAKAYLCKAYKSGSCIVKEKDTGPCSWKPEDWTSCNVVIENKKLYGSW
jgi:HEAT repeat protein